MKRTALLLPHAVVFIASMGVMIVELVASRLVAKYLGNSLYTWTGVIGIVLGGISLGNWLGGRLADRHPPRRVIPRVLLAASVLTVLIVALDIVLGLLTRVLATDGMSVGILARSLIMITVLFFLPAAALGMVSPLMAKYAIQESAGVGKTVGGIYAAGSLGSIGGTFLTGYFLIPAFGLAANILTVGAALAALSLLMGGRRAASAAWLAVVIALLVTGAPQKISRALLERSSESAKLMYQKDSPYSYIQVVEKPAPGGRERTLRLDALIHNRYNPGAPDALLYQYERIFAALTAAYSHEVLHGEQFDTLTLGGGAFTLPAWLERHYPRARHTVVEIDPEVVRTAAAYFDLPAQSAITIQVEDARTYVEGAREAQYDMAYCDAFNAYSVPAHLTTREFASEITRVLKPDGMLLANVIDILQSGKFLGAYLHTLSSVFPSVSVYMPTDSSFTMRTTFVLAATRGWTPPDALVDAGGNLVARKLSAEKLPASRRGTADVLTDDHAPVENLMAPVFLRSVN